MEQRCHFVRISKHLNEKLQNYLKINILYKKIFRYNITTGKYPFEGDNIYRLYENIGKGDYTIPPEVDVTLKSLLQGMLQKDADIRFTLQQVKKHEWTNSTYPKDEEKVPIPPLRGDKWRSMTVLPYLIDHHYNSVDNPVYYTERELNGKTREKNTNYSYNISTI